MEITGIKEMLTYLVANLVDDPEAIQVNVLENGNTITLQIISYRDDSVGTLVLERVNGNQLKVVSVQGIIIDDTITESILIGSTFGDTMQMLYPEGWEEW